MAFNTTLKIIKIQVSWNIKFRYFKHKVILSMAREANINGGSRNFSGHLSINY